MKLSENTVSVLKNFSTINPGMVFRKGNIVRTMAKGQNILAEATVDNIFDESFVIYDLNRLLSVLSFMKEPDIVINVDTKSLEINDKNSNALYRCSDEVMVVSPPDQGLSVDDAQINFRLTSEALAQVMKLGGVLGMPNIVVRGDRTNISIAATDTRNGDSDVFWINVGETTAEFESIFNYENLKIISDSYNVSITTEGIAQFSNDDKSIQYWIATESGSTYAE